MAMPHEAPGSLVAALAGLKVSFDPQHFRWRGVEAQAYKFALGDQRGMGWRDVSRFILAGPPVVPSRFELRYFELAAGGYSSLEQHAHVHCIVVLRGRRPAGFARTCGRRGMGAAPDARSDSPVCLLTAPRCPPPPPARMDSA